MSECKASLSHQNLVFNGRTITPAGSSYAVGLGDNCAFRVAKGIFDCDKIDQAGGDHTYSVQTVRTQFGIVTIDSSKDYQQEVDKLENARLRLCNGACPRAGVVFAQAA